eukprot:1153884-Pelagomonas_calceolata.AAC.2
MQTHFNTNRSLSNSDNKQSQSAATLTTFKATAIQARGAATVATCRATAGQTRGTAVKNAGPLQAASVSTLSYAAGCQGQSGYYRDMGCKGSNAPITTQHEVRAEAPCGSSGHRYNDFDQANVSHLYGSPSSKQENEMRQEPPDPCTLFKTVHSPQAIRICFYYTP